MAHKFPEDKILLLKSKDPYDWMSFIRCFCSTYGYYVKWHAPLSKNIYRELRNILPKQMLTNAKIYRALRFHCKSPKYLIALIHASKRFNLSGKEVDLVSQDDKNFAWSELYKFHNDVAKRLMAEHRKMKSQKLNQANKKKNR